MAEYKFEKLTRFAVKPLGKDEGLAFRLSFHSGKDRQDTIQFQLSSKHAMIFLHALKRMQEKFDWPMPKKTSKKPALRVVVDNDKKDD